MDLSTSTTATLSGSKSTPSSSSSTTNFYEVVLKAKIAKICESVGYHAITQDSSNILVDIYRRTFYHLARHSKDLANINRRHDVTYFDLAQAFNFVGIPISELQEYLKTNKLPINFDVQKDNDDDELARKTTNQVQRNVPIDDLLEAEKNVQIDDLGEDGENKAFSEIGHDDDLDKPVTPLLKDTYEEIANKFTDITPVVADKKIRIGVPIFLVANSKLKISAPIPPEAGPSTSGIETIKLGKKKSKKNRDSDNLVAQSPIKGIKHAKGGRKKKLKLTKEFVMPEDEQNSDKEVPKEKVKIKINKQDKKLKGKNISKDKNRVKRPYNKKAKVAIKPLDPAVVEPPSFFPIEEDAQPAPLTIKSEKLTPSPKLTKENKTKRKKRDDDRLDEDALDGQEPDTPTKKSRGRKKVKSSTGTITPLDPSIAEPPSFFQILESKAEDFQDQNDDLDIEPSPRPASIRLPTPTITTVKQSTSKGGKKKKKSNANQFAIVTETVTDIDKQEEQEWFCPGCGSSEDGDWVQCDSCEDWYHLICSGLKKAPEDEERWECVKCVSKAKPQSKKPQTPNLEPTKLKTPEPLAPKITISSSSLLAQSVQAPLPVSASTSNPEGTVVNQEDLCPVCNLPDNGTMMIQCDDPFCARWFHGDCVNLVEEPKEDESWFCTACVEKQQSAFKRRRKAK